jgi:DNA-binding NtrC family response regulator
LSAVAVLLLAEPQMRERLAAALASHGFEVRTASRGEGVSALLPEGGEGVLIAGSDLPDAEAELLLGRLASVAPYLGRLRLEAVDDGTPRGLTSSGEVLEGAEAIAAWAEEVVAPPALLPTPVGSARGHEVRADGGAIDLLIPGSHAGMRRALERMQAVAAADTTVLIEGESGTGKDLAARLIHQCGPRRRGPWVPVNCGAIPESLMESELFGHVKGAFTGADEDKIGLCEAADGGTLFLDEIGELPVALQVKLLRALQEHVVTKVGGTEPESVDIRVLAATNRVLEEEIRAGRFREDLFYRLNVVNIHLPPLRDRGDDLEIIARYLLGKTAREHNPRVRGFTKSCLGALRGYRWPGNVRQLENRLKRAVVMAEGTLLTAEDMDLKPEDIEDVLPLAEARDRFQARYINQVLERNGGNRTKTARDLGVDARTIFRHLKKLSELDDPIDPETGELGLEVDPFDHDEPARP